MKNYKNIIAALLLDWRAWIIIILCSYALFTTINPSKAMTHIVCKGAICQIKDYKDNGALLNFSQISVDECKTFGIEEKSQNLLNFLDAIDHYSYQYSRSKYRTVREHKNKYFKYTITCTNKNGYTYPIFKTTIKNREKAQDFADTLGYELSKENPAVDMEFKEK